MTTWSCLVDPKLIRSLQLILRLAHFGSDSALRVVKIYGFSSLMRRWANVLRLADARLVILKPVSRLWPSVGIPLSTLLAINFLVSLVVWNIKATEHIARSFFMQIRSNSHELGRIAERFNLFIHQINQVRLFRDVFFYQAERLRK